MVVNRLRRVVEYRVVNVRVNAAERQQRPVVGVGIVKTEQGNVLRILTSFHNSALLLELTSEVSDWKHHLRIKNA
jgi:hypothetical protein